MGTAYLVRLARREGIRLRAVLAVEGPGFCEWGSYMQYAVPSTIQVCSEWWFWEICGFVVGCPRDMRWRERTFLGFRVSWRGKVGCALGEVGVGEAEFAGEGVSNFGPDACLDCFALRVSSCSPPRYDNSQALLSGKPSERCRKP